MIAIIRIAGLRIRGTNIDVQWEVFWQEVEATVSVTMVSITAFRSLFGIKALKAREKKYRPWYSYREKLFSRQKKKSIDSSSDGGDELPQIPGATMTGMRTFIRGDRGVRTMMMGSEANETTLSKHDWDAKNIRVTHHMSSESEKASDQLIFPLAHG